MKRFFSKNFALWSMVVLSLLSTTLPTFAQNSNSFRIIVFDAESQLPVIGVSLSRHKDIAPTKGDGILQIPPSLLKGDSLHLHAIGYLPLTVAVQEVRHHQPLRVQLRPMSNQLNEAVVSGQRVLHTQNAVANSITTADIAKNLGNTFASMLEQVSGVSMIQTGSTIAKPVVHGMYGNRLLIMNNGVRQQGQQWGVDHAPELDASAAGRVTVVKGAEAVRYGSEALGGVVLMDAQPLPYGQRKIMGKLSGLYGTNGRKYAVTQHLSQSFPLFGGDAAWRVQGTYVNGGDRSTGSYLLNNTGMREVTASAALGWRNSRLELQGFYSFYSTQVGVLYSAQMGDEELLRERIKIGQPVNFYPWTRSIDYPHQKVVHHVGKLEGRYTFANKSRLSVKTAWQHDDRREYNQRRNYRSMVPTLDLRLNNFQTDAQWKHTYADNWSSEIGAFYGAIDNYNEPGTGVVPIIPNYTQQNLGAYGIQKYTGHDWGAELGARADHQTIDARGKNIYGENYGNLTRYTNFTYSAGAHYHVLPQLDVLTNFGTAWRAPHVHELYSYGVEQSSGLFARGDSTLRPEVSAKWVTSLRYASKRITASVDAYLQWIDHYIYDEPTKEVITMVSGAYPVFQYRSANAFFRGIDADFSAKITPKLHYTVGGSMVWANETKTNRPLPYIPSFRATQSLAYHFGHLGHLHDIHAKVTHRFVAKQTRFDAKADLIDHTPPAYQLWGAELSANFVMRNGHHLQILLTADNIFNLTYREYTNRFRYYAHDLGRDMRLMLTWDF